MPAAISRIGTRAVRKRSCRSVRQVQGIWPRLGLTIAYQSPVGMCTALQKVSPNPALRRTRYGRCAGLRKRLSPDVGRHGTHRPTSES